MKNRPLFFIALISLFAINAACAGDKETLLPPIIITPSRTPEETSSRSVSYIEKEDFYRIAGTSVNDIVKDLDAVDLRQRGFNGVQADLNIRGTTFEQSAVLLNGVRINDPQTGHHNMDIPLTTMDLERVELMRGGASALYGSDAFGGTLNIITKRPAGREVNTAFSVGSNDFISEGVSITQPAKDLKNRVSFERKDSSGYRGKPTAFHVTTFSFDSLLEGEWGEVEMLGGYTYKDFGASTFYSSLYPNEHESTDTRLGIVRGKFSGGAVTIEPKIYYRRHWDRYILDNDRPFWFRNTHKTYTLGTDIQGTVETDAGTVTFGSELAQDKIDSTNLNKHKRNRQALFAGYGHKFLCGLAMDVNIRSDHFSEFGWEISPSASVDYELNDRVKIRAAVDRAYRVPSFTDLYYVSPGNIGNANLKPESAWSYEAGTEYKDKFLKISNTVFNRNAERTIDWVRNSAADPWRAVNSGRIDTFGVENAIEVKTGEILNNIFVERVRLGYNFITSEKHRGSEAFSKYAMDYLRHNLSLETGSRLPFGIENTFRFSYKRRFDQHGYFFLENKTSKKIDIAGFHAEFYIEGTNLLNTSYEEVTGVPAPGIWIVGGMKAQF